MSFSITSAKKVVSFMEKVPSTPFLANPENGHIATVPRHREIENFLAKKILISQKLDLDLSLLYLSQIIAGVEAR